MVFESELIGKDDIEVGATYRGELINLYAHDYNCVLIVLNTPPNIFMSNDNRNYKVKQIIENSSVIVPTNDVVTHHHYNKIIIMEEV